MDRTTEVVARIRFRQEGARNGFVVRPQKRHVYHVHLRSERSFQIRDFRTNIKKLGETKTILLSTHILQEVKAVAERVLLVHTGSVVFDGTPAELEKDAPLDQTFYKMTDYGRAEGTSRAGEGV